MLCSPKWCIHTISIALSLSLAAAGCSDEGSAPSTHQDPNGFGVEGEEFQCNKDLTVLQLMHGTGRDCGCIPGDDACVLTACTPDACDPLLGYQCVGEVEVAPDGQGNCPIRFTDDGQGSCVSSMPFLCTLDKECIQGAYCDVAAGGICTYDCLQDSDCNVGAGETCDCTGRCVPPEGAEPPAIPHEALVLSVTPLALNFDEALAPGTELDAAQYVRVGLGQPLQQDEVVRVVASRGLLVACPAAYEIGQKPTSIDTYAQECWLDLRADDPLVKKVWTVPTDLETPVAPPWGLEIRHGTAPYVSVRRVDVTTTESVLNVPQSGTWTGTVSVSGTAWSDSAVDLDDQAPVASALTVPVFAEVEVDDTTPLVRILFSDPMHVLASSGELYVDFGEDLTNPVGGSIPITLGGSEILFLGREDTAEGLEDTEVYLTAEAPAGIAGTESAIEFDARTGGLAGRFYVGTRGTDRGTQDERVHLAFTFELSIQDKGSRTVVPPPSVSIDPSAVADDRYLKWSGQEGLLVPSEAYTLTSWLDYVGSNTTNDTDLAGCLVSSGSADVFIKACKAWIAPLFVGEPDFDALCLDIAASAYAAWDSQLPGTDVLAMSRGGIPCLATDYVGPEYTYDSSHDIAACPSGVSGPIPLQLVSSSAGGGVDVPIRYMYIDSHMESWGLGLVDSSLDFANPSGWFAELRRSCEARLASYDPAARDPSAFESDPLAAEAYYDLEADTLGAISGDFAVLGGTVSSTFGLFHQADQRSIDPDAAVLQAPEMLEACVQDLSRERPKWHLDGTSPIAAAFDSSPGPPDIEPAKLRERLLEFFANDGCIGKANILGSMAWTTPSAGTNALHATLLMRRAQQWLQANAFVARQGRLERELSDTMAADDPDVLLGVSEPVPNGEARSLQDLVGIVGGGLNVMLHPDIYGALRRAPDEAWIQPDYRGHYLAWAPQWWFDQIDSGWQAYDVTRYPDQGAGLPVVMLETAAAYLELVTAYLDETAAQSFVGCVPMQPDDEAAKVLQSFGEASRQTAVLEGFASALTLKAETAANNASTTLPWLESWTLARETFGAARTKALAAARRVLDCRNPLGISATDLPLFFVDPQGVNQRFFASSDYLLTQWAEPAVNAANTALDAARNAWLQKRNSEIQQLMTEFEADRRMENLKATYGKVIVEACGLSMSPEEALDKAAAGEINLGTCHMVPPEENPACEERIAAIFEATDYSKSMAQGCDEGTAGNYAQELYETKLDLCMISREFALGLPVAQGGLNVQGSYAALWERVAAKLAVDPEDPSVHFSLRGMYPEYVEMKAIIQAQVSDISQMGALQTNRYEGGVNEVPDSWPLLDHLDFAPCTDTLMLGGQPALGPGGGELNREAVTQWLQVLTASIESNPTARDAWYGKHVEYKPFKKTVHHPVKLSEWETYKNLKLERWCKDYLLQNPLPEGTDLPEMSFAEFEPNSLAECYRGSLGEHDIAILQARQAIQETYSQFDAAKKRYDLAVRQCIFKENNAENRRLALEEHQKATIALIESKEAIGKMMAIIGSVIASAVATVTTFGAGSVSLVGVVALVGTLASSATDIGTAHGPNLDGSQQKLDLAYQKTREALDSNEALNDCWTQVANVKTTIDGYYQSVKQSMLGLSARLEARGNLINQVMNAVRDGHAAAEREEGRKMPSVAHHYWLSEEVDRFKSDFAWAKQLTYLASLAVEYEFQQTLSLGDTIMQARHPDELKDSIRDMQRELASRGINGNRPTEATTVLSLRDDILGIPDDTSAPDGEWQLAPEEKFQAQLLDPSHAIYSKEGEYLGQGFRFSVAPEGAMHYRCAERLWSIHATIEGDMLGSIAPGLPVFVMKRNTFASQWCDGRGPDGEEFQYASTRPSAALLRPGSESAGPGDTEAYSWAYIDAWINVKRKDFYSDNYKEGHSEELAGRGLYGEYILLFPWYGFIDEDVRLEHIEDVLVRFDYLSVSNGPPLSEGGGKPEPVEPDELPCEGENCPLINGSECTLDSQCKSDACVDGTCCQSLCDGPCEAGCNLLGQCIAEAPGVDPLDACGSNYCDGSGECATSCNVDQDCKGVRQCIDGVCEPGLVLAGGSNHTCGSCYGTTRCWGWNQSGVLGNSDATLIGGDQSGASATPTDLTISNPELSEVRRLVGGNKYTCGLLMDGTLSCWGIGSSGQLGSGSQPSVGAPSLVQTSGGTLTGVVDVSASVGSTTCAVSGTDVYCWGANDYYQRDPNASTTLTTLAGVVLESSSTLDAVAVATGYRHTCAIVDPPTNRVKCWGSDTYGQQGNASDTLGAFNVVKSTTGTGELTGAIAIGAGEFHTCALLDTGEVACWGRNSSYQLGGTGGNQTYPALVPGPGGTGTLVDASALAIGKNFSCALTDESDDTTRVRCWGYNGQNQLSQASAGLEPYPVEYRDTGAAAITDAIAISAGENHACVVRSDNDVICAGSTSNSKLGIGGSSTPNEFSFCSAP